MCFFVYWYAHLRDLHSFPTRRSSDLASWTRCWGVLLIGTPPRSVAPDRKSTRLNSSHVSISYAVFCLKKKNGLPRKVRGIVDGTTTGPDGRATGTGSRDVRARSEGGT